MTDRTERHLAWVDDGRDREGQKGMTERHLARVDDDRGHEGMTKGSRA